MTATQAPKTIRRTRASGSRVVPDAGATRLSTFYKRQRDAVQAARTKGIKEVEVSFSIPGAKFVTKVKVGDLEQLAVVRRPKRSRLPAETADLAPTEKLRSAIEEAKDVTVFYKTSQELFDALEKQE